MEIQYLGHASFKLRDGQTVVVTDPYEKGVGFEMPRVSADVVTVSHGHFDHNKVKVIRGTTRRSEPFVITEPGEYEVGGVSVFGYKTWHDDKEGQERGENTIYLIEVGGVRVLHLGDLGHKLSSKLVSELGEVDVILVPVGGVYTLGPKQAVEVVERVGAEIVIPMHYRTSRHDQKVFGELADLGEFLEVIGAEPKVVEEKLKLTRLDLAGEGREVVVFKDWMIQ